jgi:ATP-dependent helicase HrpB
VPLPIDEVLPELITALDAEGRAVLQAPPGAGKTTGVPLALLNGGAEGRILMLEPRRLAARAAAERMAEMLGETCGQTVGYRIRGEAKVSAATRIEVVTEGILTRMVQDAPDLPGIGTVIFDEFHERSLNADLGLALTWEARGALRPDLRILVMSATLDAGPVAAMLDDAPVISSEGRAFPVDTIWLDRPPGTDTRWERQMADLILRAMSENDGSCLAFLPGEGEIRRVASLVSGRLPPDVHIRPLYGALALPRSARRDPARSLGPQARARHLYRGDLADHRGRAHRGGWRQGAARALRCGPRHEPPRHRGCQPGRGRPAAWPRGAHRAGRVLPALDAGPGRRAPGLRARRDRGRRPRGPRAGTGAMGRGGGAAISHPPPEGALARRARFWRRLARSMPKVVSRPMAATSFGCRSTRGSAISCGAAGPARHGSPPPVAERDPMRGTEAWASTSSRVCARSTRPTPAPMPASSRASGTRRGG